MNPSPLALTWQRGSATRLVRRCGGCPINDRRSGWDALRRSTFNPLRHISAFDARGGSTPLTLRDSFLVQCESRSVAEPLFDSPDPRVFAASHFERDAALLGASQRDVSRKMFVDGSNVGIATADERPRQMDSIHLNMVQHRNTQFDLPCPIIDPQLTPRVLVVGGSTGSSDLLPFVT